MSTKRCVLLLGSNIYDRNKYLDSAIDLIRSRLGYVVEESERIETKPVGFRTENTFLNQKLLIEVNCSPVKLLREVKKIECDIGRKKREPHSGESYSDREIDIDILFYENIKFESLKLKIPHNQVYERPFVSEIKLKKNKENI